MATTYNESTDLALGNAFMLYVTNTTGGTQPIAFGETLELNTARAEVDTTNKFSGKFKSANPSTISWTVSSDFLYTSKAGAYNYDTLLAAQFGTGQLDIVIGEANGAEAGFGLKTALWSGKVNIASISNKMEMNQYNKCSISLNGTGDLTAVPAV